MAGNLEPVLSMANNDHVRNATAHFAIYPSRRRPLNARTDRDSGHRSDRLFNPRSATIHAPVAWSAATRARPPAGRPGACAVGRCHQRIPRAGRTAACRYPQNRLPAGIAGQRASRSGGSADPRSSGRGALWGDRFRQVHPIAEDLLDASLGLGGPGLGRGCFGRIGHTQPRRIAARSLASRLSAELGTELGSTVGYKVRFHDRVQPTTAVKLMTDGMLLAEIQQDRYLNEYDTLIIDEAHERSLNIDFLLGWLKQILPKRPDLKLIVTSATIDPQRFSRHFDDAPVIEISGRTYPVEVRYRPADEEFAAERDDAMQLAISNAVDELARAGRGDVLVFLSGEREIRVTAETLRKHHPASTEILPLFARQGPGEQARVFQSHAKRRVVLATNVAETSLTVPGIHYVVDPGFARISRYSHRSKVQRLPVERISRASANQRKGRCGRIASGICIRLYTEENFDARAEFTEPEIRRTNLASVILQMKLLGFGAIENFPFLDPPDTKLISDGYRTLEELAAVDADGELTALGRQLARLPVDPRIGRMLLAAESHHCLREVLIIASALSVQDPRDRPLDKQQLADQMHATWQHEDSDFMTLLNLWEFLRRERKSLSRRKFQQQCRQHFLSWNRAQEWLDVHTQLREQMRELGHRENATQGTFEQCIGRCSPAC